MQRKSMGLGLFEILLVLVLMSVFLLMSVRYFSSANAAKQRAEAVDKMNRMFEASQAYINAGGDPKNVLIAATGDSVLVDEYYLSQADTKNPWHGNVMVCWGMGDGCSDNSATTLKIQMTGVKEQDCLHLLSALKNSTVSHLNSCSGEGAAKTLTVFYQLF
jgi:Tfp pilus assembly protein PilV